MPDRLVKKSLFTNLKSFEKITVLTNKHVLSFLYGLNKEKHNNGKNLQLTCEEIRKYFLSINATPCAKTLIRHRVEKLRNLYENARKTGKRKTGEALQVRRKYFEALKNAFSGSVGIQPNIQKLSPGPSNEDLVVETFEENSSTCSNIRTGKSPSISSLPSSCGSSEVKENTLKINESISPEKLEIVDQSNMPLRPSSRLLKVPKSTLHRNITNHRKEIVEHAKKNLDRSKNYVLHFDGKSFYNAEKGENAERQCFVITRMDKREELILGIPFLDDKRAITISKKATEILKEWSLGNCITALGFDTTATNTGRHGGVAVNLSKENGLNKDLIWLPCRHHIAEIVLGSVIALWEKTTSGPDVDLFKNFRDKWNKRKIQKTNYEVYFNDNCKSKKVIEKKFDRTKLISFIKSNLETKQVRDDYKELLELALTFLGGNSKYQIKTPGNTSRARWMQKAIYSLKIYMFHKELDIDAKERDILEEICLFLVFVYIPYWYDCSNGIHALKNDKTFVEDIWKFGTIYKTVAEEALKKFKNHLWYMGYRLSALSFFDERISLEDKREMVRNLELEDHNQDDDSKRIRDAEDLNLSLDRKIKMPSFGDFISKSTLEFFKIMKIETSFLEYDPDQWNENEDFLESKDQISYLQVVNDAAERSLSLIKCIKLKKEKNIQDSVISKSFSKINK